MAWWSRKKETAIEEAQILAEKIDAVQYHKDVSTLSSELHGILSTINKRLNELETMVEEQGKRLEEMR
jgi:hypothetical protein